ncbi:MAG: hypothetical protein AAF416_09640 [Pseudomonadota bacterium]
MSLEQGERAEESDRPPHLSPEDIAVGRRRQRDAAMALPVAGAILLASPLSFVFAVDARVLGIPIVVAYVFVAWAALIFAAWAVGRRVLADTGPQADAAPTRTSAMPARGTGRSGANAQHTP